MIGRGPVPALGSVRAIRWMARNERRSAGSTGLPRLHPTVTMQEPPTAMTDATDATGVTITVRDNAFLRVAGPITLLDGEGNAFAVEAGKIVTLCRCGGSAAKPFCDSSHRTNGFTSVVRAALPGAEEREDPAAG
jgi:CDGSH-type Zn-finger protein